MNVQYGTSKRGKQTVIHHNYEYVRDKNNVNGTISWRCCKYVSKKCKARIVTKDDQVVSGREPEHTHTGNVSTSLARKAVGEMKAALSQVDVTPHAAYAAVASTKPDDVLMALPKRTTIARCLRRHKHKINNVDAQGFSLPPVPTSLNFVLPNQFVEMIQFDSGPGDDRIIILASPEMLDGLSRSDIWLGDGTFKITPTIFFQLYTIHFDNGNGFSPVAVYGLLHNKNQETYTRLLQEVTRLIPGAHPRKILVDFERAAMNAFAGAYPKAVVTGCYFHLCQNVLRKVNEVGLKTVYETDNVVRGFVRCLPAVAFVPPADVEAAFETLASYMPDTEHIDEVVTYFEHTYVRGRRQRGRGYNYAPALFPIHMWNQYEAGTDGVARTTNSVEGWHYGIQSLFQCSHPTLWTFLKGIQRDMATQKATYLQQVAGVVQPARRQFRDITDRMRRVTAGYGSSDIETYLRAVAHLSHQ